jgi:hypothetical protein
MVRTQGTWDSTDRSGTQSCPGIYRRIPLILYPDCFWDWMLPLTLRVVKVEIGTQTIRHQHSETLAASQLPTMLQHAST